MSESIPTEEDILTALTVCGWTGSEAVEGIEQIKEEAWDEGYWAGGAQPVRVE